MAKSKIPIRPNENISGLSDIEKDCITWIVISGRPPIDCWLCFVAPSAAGNPKAKESFDKWKSRANVRNYMKAYEEKIKDFLTPKKKIVSTDGLSREQKAEAALNTFKDNVIDSLGEEGVTDVEVLKDKGQLAKTIGLLKEEEVVQAPPIRYLPTRCAECNYKQFIDEQVKLGNIIEDEDN